MKVLINKSISDLIGENPDILNKSGSYLVDVHFDYDCWQKTRRERVRRNSIKINHEDIINEKTGGFWA